LAIVPVASQSNAIKTIDVFALKKLFLVSVGYYQRKVVNLKYEKCQMIE